MQFHTLTRSSVLSKMHSRTGRWIPLVMRLLIGLRGAQVAIACTVPHVATRTLLACIINRKTVALATAVKAGAVKALQLNREAAAACTWTCCSLPVFSDSSPFRLVYHVKSKQQIKCLPILGICARYPRVQCRWKRISKRVLARHSEHLSEMLPVSMCPHIDSCKRDGWHARKKRWSCAQRPGLAALG